jgi:hypothetical protein
MRGRWASMTIGAGKARHRAGAAMDQERQGYESQLDQSQRQIEAQQRQIEALQQQKYQQPQHEDPTIKSCKNMLISDKKDYSQKRSFKNSRRTYYPRCSLQSALELVIKKNACS